MASLLIFVFMESAVSPIITVTKTLTHARRQISTPSSQLNQPSNKAGTVWRRRGKLLYFSLSLSSYNSRQSSLPCLDGGFTVLSSTQIYQLLAQSRHVNQPPRNDADNNPHPITTRGGGNNHSDPVVEYDNTRVKRTALLTLLA